MVELPVLTGAWDTPQREWYNEPCIKLTHLYTPWLTDGTEKSLVCQSTSMQKNKNIVNYSTIVINQKANRTENQQDSNILADIPRGAA